MKIIGLEAPPNSGGHFGARVSLDNKVNFSAMCPKLGHVSNILLAHGSTTAPWRCNNNGVVLHNFSLLQNIHVSSLSFAFLCSLVPAEFNKFVKTKFDKVEINSPILRRTSGKYFIRDHLDCR